MYLGSKPVVCCGLQVGMGVTNASLQADHQQASFLQSVCPFVLTAVCADPLSQPVMGWQALSGQGHTPLLEL